MPLISYSKFPEKIESGEKTHTIRSRRKYPIKQGDWLSLWWKSRTPERRKFGESTCLSVTPIVIEENSVTTPNTEITLPELLETFASQDGFDSWAEMKDFFRPKFGESLELIEWSYPLKK